jgi:hypothetical protein
MKYSSAVFNKRFSFVYSPVNDNKDYKFFVTIAQLAEYYWSYRPKDDEHVTPFKDLTEPTKLALVQLVFNLWYADACEEFLSDDVVVEDLYNSYGYNQLED